MCVMWTPAKTRTTHICVMKEVYLFLRKTTLKCIKHAKTKETNVFFHVMVFHGVLAIPNFLFIFQQWY